jgi:heme oxygenase
MQPSPFSTRATLSRLKRATAPAHIRLEETAGRFARAHDRAGYARYLGRLLGFYEPLEPLLDRFLRELPGLDLESRRKAPLLQTDLAWLGVDARLLPRCEELPSVSTRACALGVLYVIEGATLGGRVQLSRLGEPLGVSRAGGAAYLGCYGNDVDAQWQAVRDTIAAAAIDEAAVREAVRGACATFEALDGWLRSP